MSSSLSEKLVGILRDRINRGELAPGTLVIEPALAQEFEVSKTPVRESLRQLASEGLLQVLPKKGYLVRPISLNDVYEVLELRCLLEPHVAGQVAMMHSADLVVQLAGHLEDQEKFAISDPISSMHAAQRFHSALCAASRNSRLVAVLEGCYTQTARAHYVLPAMQPYMSQSDELAEHRRILAAIQGSDAAAATEAMAVHMESIRRAMLGND